MARSVVARRDRAVRLLDEGVRTSGNALHPHLQSFLAALHSLDGLDTLRLFDDWWAGCLFAAPVSHPTADVEPTIRDEQRLTWLFVTSILGGGERAFAICPSDAVRGAEGRLYLPDQHVLLDVDTGPVAGFAEAGRIRFVRADGAALTYHSSRPLPRGTYCNGRVRALEVAAGWPVLNAMPVFANFHRLKVAGQAGVSRAVATIESGFGLLERAWPSAAAFASRVVRGVVVLDNPGAARSHTGPRLPAVIMCTAERPELVAEALCHELSHLRMNLILEAGPILHEDTSVHASPWRTDPRPLIGLVHGVHAFLNVRKFYERLGRLDGSYGAAAVRVVTTQTQKIRAAWQLLERHARWTAEGEAIAADLKAAVDEL